jgi:hypothetical protein
VIDPLQKVSAFLKSMRTMPISKTGLCLTKCIETRDILLEWGALLGAPLRSEFLKNTED